MRSRSWPALAGPALALALLLTVVSPDARAAVSIRPPAGSPDPKQMVLRTSDLGRGAKVTKQGYYKDADFSSVISYTRELESGRVGSTELPWVGSDAEIGTSAQATASFLNSIRRLLGSKQGRELLKEGFAEEFPILGLITNVQVGRPRNLGLGAGSFDLLITVKVLGVRTELHIAAFRVDRALGAVGTVSAPGKRVPLSVMTRLAKIMAGRMGPELAPKNTARPVVSGTPQVGQTLTAAPGTWTGGPTFTYQWQRCDSAGSNCGDITAAMGQSYVVADADGGSTIRVVVTARNAFGEATAASGPTAVVPVGTPTNTSPPTISGAPQVGQTLTAGTGGWTGNPTSFSFQWQRCDAGGASCVVISGATAGTYVLGSADLGSTVRVAVTARNSVGEATAVSAPTSVVT